jgi:DNA primase
MRTVVDRPVLLERYPNGVREKSFFQKRIPDSAPDWLVTTTVETINGTPSRALVIADLAHVLWAANMGVLGLHVWPFRASDPEDASLHRNIDV